MNTKGIINYQTVQQFEEAMWLSFEAAQEEDPNDPVLQAISIKRDAATTSRNAYHDACKENASKENASKENANQESVGKDGGMGSAAAQTNTIADLKKIAVQAQQEVDSAVRKWYSAQWQGKQAARRGR